MNDLVKNKILNSIHFDDDRKNMDKVNCYAYALGIDLNEDDICSFAYNPGQMGTFIKYSDNYELYLTMCMYLHGKSFEDRVKIDMEALGIDISESSMDEDSEYIDSEGYYNWLIAMYTLKTKLFGLKDIHFLRKNTDGTWTHKLGREGIPTCLDSEGNPIYYLPDELAFENKKVYNKPNVYKLRIKR